MNEWQGEHIFYEEGDYDALLAVCGQDLLDGCRHNSHERLAREVAEVLFSWSDGTSEPNFAWIVRLDDGRFAAVSGSHDYTGWDCMSGLHVDHIGVTEAECVPFLTDDPRREYEAAHA